MSARTLTLVLLSGVGLGVTAILVAVAQLFAVPGGWSTPWLVPLIAVPACTAVFFAGRRQLLPLSIAASSGRAASTLLLVTSGSMVATFAALWVLQRLFGGVRAGWFVALWVVFLWIAIDKLQRFAGDRPLPP